MPKKHLTVAGAALALAFTLYWIHPRARGLLDLANAGTAYSAKLLCSGVLVGGLNADRIRAQELARAEGVVEAEIHSEEARVEAWALFGLVDAVAVRHPGLGCSLAHDGEPPTSLPTITRHEPVGLPEWSGPNDPRSHLTLDHLLRMSSGLEFGENTSDLRSDLVTMLFDAPAAGVYAAVKPLAYPPDSVWAYSSGTTNIVARAVRLAVADDTAYWRLPYDRLFAPVGMHTALIETDPSGTFVGSSFSYASARDWARFGLLYLNDGVWGEERILPEGWVTYATTPTPTDPTRGYGAHWWLNAGGAWSGVPRDAFRAQGFEGQYLSVIPSADVVIVRLGQTPGQDFDMAALERAVLEAVEPAAVGPAAGAGG